MRPGVSEGFLQMSCPATSTCPVSLCLRAGYLSAFLSLPSGRLLLWTHAGSPRWKVSPVHLLHRQTQASPVRLCHRADLSPFFCFSLRTAWFRPIKKLTSKCRRCVSGAPRDPNLLCQPYLAFRIL